MRPQNILSGSGGSPVKFWNPRTLLRYSMAVASGLDGSCRLVAGIRTLGHLNDRARNRLVRNHHRSLTLFSAKYAHVSSERLILDGNTIGIQAFTDSFEAMSGV